MAEPLTSRADWTADGRIAAADTLSAAAARAVVGTALSLLAAATVATHLAQVLGISFRLYSAALAVTWAAVLGGSAVAAVRRLRSTGRRDHATLALLTLLAVGGGAMAATAHRLSTDDYYYLPNTVYAREHPAQPMGFHVHFFHPAAEPVVSHAFSTALPFEYGQAAVARWTGADLLTVYFLFTPVLVGMLIPLALYLVAAEFTGDGRAAWIAVAAALAAGLLAGEAARAYGHFGFTRAWQGKTLLLAVGVPFFTADSLRYFRERGRLAWAGLARTAVAMVGATASAAVVLPALAVSLAGGLLAARPCTAAIRTAASSWTALAYPLTYALLLSAAATVDLGASSPANADFPASFRGQVLLVTSAGKPATPLLLAASLLLCALIWTGARRRFLLGWTSAALLLFLNPVVAGPLIGAGVPANIYWRLFYILPFPLATGFAAVAVLERCRPRARLLLAAGAAAVLVLHLAPGSTSALRRRVTWGAPRPHIDPGLHAAALRLAEVVPRGPMLAPPQLGGTLGMLRSGYPQVTTLYPAVDETWLAAHPALARTRRAAADQVAGGAAEPVALEAVLADPALRSVVLVPGALTAPVREALDRSGFLVRCSVAGYVAAWRSADPPAPGGGAVPACPGGQR